MGSSHALHPAVSRPLVRARSECSGRLTAQRVATVQQQPGQPGTTQDRDNLGQGQGFWGPGEESRRSWSESGAQRKALLEGSVWKTDVSQGPRVERQSLTEPRPGRVQGQSGGPGGRDSRGSEGCQPRKGCLVLGLDHTPTCSPSPTGVAAARGAASAVLPSAI